MTKEEYIRLVKSNTEARNTALAIAWVMIKTFPALANPMSDFYKDFMGG